MATVVADDARHRQVARLGPASREDDPPGRRSHEGRDLVARILDGAASLARRTMGTRRVADHAVKPRLHRRGHLLAPRGRGRVVEVVTGCHATKNDFTFVNSRVPNDESSRPYPEFFVPPKGSSGIETTTAFAKTMPASMPAIA